MLRTRRLESTSKSTRRTPRGIVQRLPREPRRIFAFLVAALALNAAGAELRSLFHTPEERERLERLRRGEPEPALSAIRRPNAVTGFVKRSDGRNTVWIDGVAVPQNATAGTAALDPRSVRDATRAPDAPALEIKRTR